MNDNDYLVSCTVICYNSAKTVLETLESIKSQTYQNIELIISDDCSKDDTVDICRLWIERNKKRFVRTELITVNENTGVCANDNRALSACQGKWQKGVAADDILLPNCVDDFVRFMIENPNARWASSYMQIFKNSFSPENCIARNSVSDRSFFDLSAEEQLVKIAPWNLIQAAPNFYEVSLKREVGGNDLNFSFEDYPLFVTLLEKGYKCYFMDKETVGYRVHESISHSDGKLFNYRFVLESKKFHKERCFKYLSRWQKMGQYSIWGLQFIFEKMKLNRDTRFIKFIYKNLRSFLRKIFNQ